MWVRLPPRLSRARLKNGHENIQSRISKFETNSKLQKSKVQNASFEPEKHVINAFIRRFEMAQELKLQDIERPNLYRETFPYTEFPKVEQLKVMYGK